jgi:hypothetical protein
MAATPVVRRRTAMSTVRATGTPVRDRVGNGPEGSRPFI